MSQATLTKKEKVIGSAVLGAAAVLLGLRGSDKREYVGRHRKD